MEEVVKVGDTSGDEFLDVTFYEKDNAEGKPVVFINIKVPGDKTVEIDVEATEEYKRRFQRRWLAYEQMQTMTGTPIEEWDDIPQSMKRELHYLGFRFVEQLAGAPDSAFARVMGGHQWRSKAQAFLNRGKVSADEVIKRQQEQIDALIAKVNELANGEAPRRGRPPKDEVKSE